MGQVWVLPVWFKREKNLNVLKSPVKTSGSVGLVLSCWNTCTFEQIQSSEILNIVKEKKNDGSRTSRKAVDIFFMSKL